MISKIRVKGFRILRDFVWEPTKGINILVGPNSAGKSTVLDAIELVTCARLHGVLSRNAPSPDWFNTDDVDEFFGSMGAGNSGGITYSEIRIPETQISITFANENRYAALRGCNNPERIDAPGIVIDYKVPDDLRTQFFSDIRSSIKSNPTSQVIPCEFYECTWSSFSGSKIIRRPAEIGCSRIDAGPEPYSTAITSYTKNLIESSLDDSQMRTVAGRFRDAANVIDDKILSSVSVSQSVGGLGLQIDRSIRTDWKKLVVLQRGGLPLSSLGSAEQIITKCEASLENVHNQPLLLLEEPECHLSHSSLNILLDILSCRTDDETQLFVTTHSPFVLNRLGLDHLSIISDGHSPETISGLTQDTVRYFRKLSGYDTLRVALADRVVLVEGPTDEMVFDWAFRKTRGCLPESRGIDVISCGTQHKRLFELARALGRKHVIGLRDNDGKPSEHWQESASLFLTDEIRLMCGYDGQGDTIEPQMIYANSEHLDQLARIVKAPSSEEKELLSYMSSHKTEWALNLLDSQSDSKDLIVPGYILDAINYICPAQEGPNE